MGTKIEWTEETWNPVVGCNKVSPGCDNCYAERMAKRLRAMGKPQYQSVVNDKGWTGKTDFVEGSAFDAPLGWKAPCMVFVGSMCDLFHPSVEIGILTHVFDIIEQTPQHTYQILTKRPEQALKMMWGKHGEGWRYFGNSDYHPNIWFGVTAENQEQADKRIPILLQIPAAVRFVSIEPMLEPVSLLMWNNESECLIDQVIIGAESGPKRRECKIEWVRSIVEEQRYLDTSVFVKQIYLRGCRKCGFDPCTHLNGHRPKEFLIKDINQFPADLRIQEYPIKEKP